MSFSTLPAANYQQMSFYGKISSYIRAHPVWLLVLLSPGIPEYLSGSSSWAVLVANPIAFALLVLLNVGLYTTGLILIREAVLRWRKGWASVFILGVAYGILEEGLALQTLFNPKAEPVHELGVYGHWIGVNWVWTTGLLLFHATISIGLPLLLFGLALPNLKGKSLISPTRQKICLILLTLDCVALYGIVRYWPGWPIVIGSSVAIFLLVLLAHRAPSKYAIPSFSQPKSPRRLLLTGLLFFPAVLLTGVVGAGAGIPPVVTILLDLVFASGLLITLRRSIGSGDNSKQKMALAIGLVVPILCFGFIASLSLPIIIFADVGFLYFIRRLWKRYTSQATAVDGANAASWTSPSQPVAG